MAPTQFCGYGTTALALSEAPSCPHPMLAPPNHPPDTARNCADSFWGAANPEHPVARLRSGSNPGNLAQAPLSRAKGRGGWPSRRKDEAVHRPQSESPMRGLERPFTRAVAFRGAILLRPLWGGSSSRRSRGTPGLRELFEFRPCHDRPDRTRYSQRHPRPGMVGILGIRLSGEVATVPAVLREAKNIHSNGAEEAGGVQRMAP